MLRLKPVERISHGHSLKAIGQVGDKFSMLNRTANRRGNAMPVMVQSYICLNKLSASYNKRQTVQQGGRALQPSPKGEPCRH